MYEEETIATRPARSSDCFDVLFEIPPAACAVRRRIAETLHALPASFSMPGFAQILNTPNVGFTPKRLLSPAQLQCESSQVIALQVNQPTVDSPVRLILALPPELARKLVLCTLNCADSPNARLSSGETGALLFALDVAAGDLIAAGVPPFRIRGVLYDIGQASEYLGAPATVALTGELTIDAASFGVSLLFSNLFPVDHSPVALTTDTRMPAWPVPVSVQCGVSRIGAADLARICPGSLLVLDELCLPRHEDSIGDTQLTLCAGLRYWTAQWLDVRRIEVLTETGYVFGMKQTNRYDGIVSSPEADGPILQSAELPLEIRVEVGRVHLPVAEACSLMPGSVITLSKSIDHRVELFLEDRRIGSGVLVRSGDALAVEIEEMA